MLFGWLVGWLGQAILLLNQMRQQEGAKKTGLGLGRKAGEEGKKAKLFFEKEEVVGRAYECLRPSIRYGPLLENQASIYKE